MHICFSPEHIDLISKLKQIANKHNGEIHIVIVDKNAATKDDIWTSDFADGDSMTQELWEMLCNSYDIRNLNRSGLYIRFVLSLYDKHNQMLSCHAVDYSEQKLHFKIGNKTYEFNDLNTLEREVLQSWLDEHTEDMYFETNKNSSHIEGFEGVNHPGFYNVSGAIEVFGKVVRDYLKEPCEEKV